MDLEKRIFVIPHFHYDVAWITAERENLDRVYKILETVIEIMRKNEDFKYVIDQGFYLETMKIEKPKLFGHIIDKVHEGRMEVVNAGYVMPDLNLVSPPVIKKNYEIMNNLAKREFGVKPEVAWMIDCFGHPGIMPKIAREAGLEYYVFWRGMNEPESTQDFTWAGTDGTAVLTHWMKRGYSFSGTGIDEVYSNAERKLKKIKLTKNATGKEKLYEGKFLDRISFELEAEEGDLYNTIPSVKAALPKNAVKLRACLKDSALDLHVQTDFECPRHVLSLIVKTGIRNGRLIHYFDRDVFAERTLNTLHPSNGFFEYKDQSDDGLSFYGDDCFNYKVKHNGDVHIVLVRSVQILSHGDAGPTIPCPNALELGKHRFRILLSSTGKKRFF